MQYQYFSDFSFTTETSRLISLLHACLCKAGLDLSSLTGIPTLGDHTKRLFAQLSGIFTDVAYITNNPACSDIPAVVNQNILVIPLVSVMQDVRASRACRTMAEYFYPELFA